MKRLNWIDNAKGLLIFLVVFGHMIELDNGWGMGVTKFLLIFICIFHMPAFAFFAGYNFKNKNIASKVTYLLLLYIVFCILYYLPFWLTGRFELSQLFIPSQGLWFISALAIWMLILSTNINLYLLLILSLVASITILYSNFNGYIFSAYRTIVFIPFFVGGVICSGRKLKTITGFSLLLIILLLIATTLYFYFIGSDKLLFGSYSFEQIGISNFTGTLIKLGVIISSCIGIFLVWALSPSNKFIITKWGENSLNIFLFHFAFIKIFEYSGKYLNIHIDNNMQVIPSLIIAFIICQILSHKLFPAITNKIKIIAGKIVALRKGTVMAT